MVPIIISGFRAYGYGILRIVLQQGKEYIVVTGHIIDGVFQIGDAWVWNQNGNLWGGK